jgi:dynein light chain roadblock-type
LGRLTKKSGVKATIVLDRHTGSILKTSGQIASIRTAKIANGSGTGASFAADEIPGQETELQGAKALAALVWSFVSTAGSLVQEIDTEVGLICAPRPGFNLLTVVLLQDELKLLRLRTKKQELVVVPDSKYLLIVIHDTPPA